MPIDTPDWVRDAAFTRSSLIASPPVTAPLAARSAAVFRLG
jgi:hypothetical protein